MGVSIDDLGILAQSSLNQMPTTVSLPHRRLSAMHLFLVLCHLMKTRCHYDQKENLPCLAETQRTWSLHGMIAGNRAVVR